MLLTIFSSVFAIFFVVLIHEAGHFFVAKLVGVQVLKFSIGFGKALYSYRGKSGTEYVLALFPLGGYVKMVDEHEGTQDGNAIQGSYAQQPVWKRMAIVLAGPLSNFLLAVIIFWISFVIGINYIKPIIGEILPNSVAMQAGLQVGDEIRRIDDSSVYSWQDVAMQFIAQIGRKEQLPISVVPVKQTKEQIHYLSIAHLQIDQKTLDVLQALGVKPYTPKWLPVVAMVVPDSPAANAGLQQGDKVLTVNGKKLSDWQEIVQVIRKHPNQDIKLTGLRNNKSSFSLMVHADSKKIKNHQVIGYIGIQAKPPQWPAEMISKRQLPIYSAWISAAVETWHLIIFNAHVVWKIIVGQISSQNLSGPIGIFQGAGMASAAGLSAYLDFIAFISVALGFVNILPIPVLDGGHFLFQLIELVRGRPVSQRYQTTAMKIGLLLLLLLLVQATTNDIVRLF